VKSSYFDLSGKVAIVSGGATGIGRGIAEGLAEAGADVVIADIDDHGSKLACEGLKNLGVRAVPVPCDVSKGRDVDEMIRKTMKEFNRVDILVNNAGITGSAKAIVDMSLEDWHRTLAVNLTGVFLCSRAAAREMIKREEGRIINITSVNSFKPLPLSGDYCASKGGALMLTRVLALELIKHNIRVNAICPGFFDTAFAPALKERVKKNISRMVPIGRLGNVEEVKGLAVFLSSSASDFLVGTAIPIDGGFLIR